MKVRVNTVYEYNANGFDRFDPKTNMKNGDLCKVVNLFGCPKANTMGCCHVNDLEGNFLGLVCTSSLERTKKAKTYAKNNKY